MTQNTPYASAANATSAAAPRILVIEHQRSCDVAFLGERLLSHGAELTVTGPDTGADLPDTLEGFDALVVLGGSMDPDSDDIAPWLPHARALMREALDAELPLLGVCLGAQMLALVGGGTVQPSPTPELGVYDVNFHPTAAADPLFSGLEIRPLGQVRSLQWHFLEVTELPAGAVSLASSPRCANQAFRVGKNAWGVQFHPESHVRTAETWVAQSPDELARVGGDGEAIIAELAAEVDDIQRVWAEVFDRFLQLVTSRAA